MTRIITVKIIAIADVDDGDLITKEECAETIKKGIEEAFLVDKVTVENIQDFIMDKDGETND